MSNKETPELNFEKSIERLEEIVSKLEDGELSLDAALKLYEEGMKISQSCAKRLEEARKKIEVLTRNASGSLETEEADENLKSGKKKK